MEYELSDEEKYESDEVARAMSRADKYKDKYEDAEYIIENLIIMIKEAKEILNFGIIENLKKTKKADANTTVAYRNDLKAFRKLEDKFIEMDEFLKGEY